MRTTIPHPGMRLRGAMAAVAILFSIASADWPQFHRNGAHTAAANDETIPLGSFHKRYAIPLGSRITASPVIKDSAVYVGTHRGIFYALRENSGSILWQYMTRGKILSTAAAAEGIIVVGGMDSTVYAFTTTGALAWTVRTGGAVMAAVTYSETRKVFYVGDLRGTLYSLSLSGKIHWTFLDTARHKQPEIRFGAACADDRIALAYGDCLMRLLQDNGASYSLLWVQHYANELNLFPMTCEPVIHNGRIYIGRDCGSTNADPYVINLTNGWEDGTRTLQRYSNVIPALYTAVAADSNQIHVCWSYYTPCSYIDTTGKYAAGWSAVPFKQRQDYSLSGPALSGNYMVFQTETGVLRLIDRFTKATVYQDTFASPQLKFGFRGSSSAPAISHGSVYFGADDGNLYCYGSGPGSTVARHPGNPKGADSISMAPNPFNPSSRLKVLLSRSSAIRLEVHDASGRLVKTLFTGLLTSGTHILEWDGKNRAGRPVAAGLYVVTLTVGNKIRTTRAILAR